MFTTILTPVLALICWSLCIWFYMYARRLPAMQKAKIKPQNAKHPGSLATLPSDVRAAADNYNHLHEQPTIFYALCFYMHLAGIANTFPITLAWSYVALRILHSFIQVTVNVVLVRFIIFCLSSLTLVLMALSALFALV